MLCIQKPVGGIGGNKLRAVVFDDFISSGRTLARLAEIAMWEQIEIAAIMLYNDSYVTETEVSAGLQKVVGRAGVLKNVDTRINVLAVMNIKQ